MVSVKSLDNALPYLSCTDAGCNGNLEVRGGSYTQGKRREINSGSIICSCGREYRISGGVPYFFDSMETPRKRSIGKIKADVKRYIDNGDAGKCLDCFTELAYSFSETTGDDLTAIRNVFDFEKELMRSGMDDYTKAMVSQAATAARYNLERYRGCYVLADNVIKNMQDLGLPEGIIFEGAMATGENLARLAKKFGGNAIGIDISERMVMEAQKKTSGRDDIFVAQGSLLCIPVKGETAKLVNINNVADRVPDPPAMTSELRRISKTGGVSAIFNCSPLQFESPDGSVVYVPVGKRMDTSEMTQSAGFKVLKKYGTDDIRLWKLKTIFDGAEELPMEGVLGKR